MGYKAAIFDMDGTVLDTIGDLTNAVIYVMKAEGHRYDFDVRDVRRFFGSGALVAFERALAYEQGTKAEDLQQIGSPGVELPEGVTEKEAQRLMDVFASYYPDHCEEETSAFEGIADVLRQLRSAGIKCAVVSNKIDAAVQIMAENYFPGMFDFAIGLSDKARRKPFPDMVDGCLEVLGVEREEAVYIGDSEVDIQTAANAGMDCISVTWGFRGADYLKEQGASCIIDRPAELIEAILG